MLSRLPSRRRGFSIIEMSVVLVVIGILLASVLPMAAVWMQNLRVRNVAEGIQNGMQVARNEAVRRNMPITFHLVSLSDTKLMDDSCKLSGTGVSWVVSVSSPVGKCSGDPSTTTAPMIVSKYAGGVGGEGVEVASKDSDGDAAMTMTFNAFGQLVNADAIRTMSITMPGCSECRALQVEVSTTGSVRMCDPKVDTKGTDPRRCTITPA